MSDKLKGMPRYEAFVRRAKSTLTYDPGWSRDNLTGGWRTLRPVKDLEKCTSCDMCWLMCPEGCIERMTYEIDLTYCKGCGICSEECKVGAIVMRREDGVADAGDAADEDAGKADAKNDQGGAR